MVDVTAGTLQKDVKVVGIVSGGHFMSHYYSMMLPPLIPLLHNEMNVSYTALGLLLSLKSLSAGSMQLPAGILVDRYGARLILVFGFAIMLASYFIISVTHSFVALGALFLIAGVGNSVFHPADYSIMNGTVDSRRIGRSFSAHTFCGHMGTALAPVMILFMVGTLGWNWREAVLASVVVGAVIVVGLLSQWRHIKEGDLSRKDKVQTTVDTNTAEDAIGEVEKELTTWQAVRQILKSTPMLFLFMFFALQALGSGAFKNFAVAGLINLHGTSLSAAGGALTGLLFASAFGVLAGGVLADFDKRHALTASIALFLTALVAILVGTIDLHYTVLVFVFTFAGLIQGIIRPARDMMIRAASPKGSIGKAFGFVFSGQAIGGTIAPIVFGAMLDLNMPQWVFYSSAIFMIICMLAVLGSAREARKEQEKLEAAQ